MKTKIFVLIGLLALSILFWYLFIKPFEFVATIRTKAHAGTINQTIKLWNTTLASAEVIDQKNLNQLNQRIQFNDSTHIYNWNISTNSDSTSTIVVSIRDIDNSIKNKLTIPFSNTDFEKRTRKTLLEFSDLLKQHLKEFKVTIVGEDKIKSTFCAYVSLKGKQSNKASGMMQTYPMLSSILNDGNIQLNGSPFIEIEKWDIKTDSIYYNFCFPLLKNDSLPQLPNIKYKQINSKKAIKAIYNGNYITSDRAWYALLDYATKEGIKVDQRPFEIFFNNPNVGGNELEWKAEVYMPLSNQ